MSNDAVTAPAAAPAGADDLCIQAVKQAHLFFNGMASGRPFDARHAARQLMQTALAAYDLATMSAHQRIDHNIPTRSGSFVAPSDVEGD